MTDKLKITLKIKQLEVEIQRLEDQPPLFAELADLRESERVKNLQALRRQKRRLARLEGS